MNRQILNPLKAGQGNGICAGAAMQQELCLRTKDVAVDTGYSKAHLYHTFYDKYSSKTEHQLLNYYNEKYAHHTPPAVPYCRIELDENDPYLKDDVRIDFTGGFLAYVNFMRYKHQIKVPQLAQVIEYSYWGFRAMMENELVIPHFEEYQRKLENYFQELEASQPNGCPQANRGIARYKLTVL